LNAPLSLRTQRELKQALGEPLAGDSELPDPQDLRPFEQRFRRVIAAAMPQGDIGLLTEQGCHNVAPLMLGKAVYQAVSSQTFVTWR
jgi:hypothetical protein